MKVPKNGFSLPCCSDCGEHNAEGCPGGRSVWCVKDQFAVIDFQARSIVDAIESLVSLTEHHLPQDRSLAQRLEGASAGALANVELIRVVADECESAARNRMVV